MMESWKYNKLTGTLFVFAAAFLWGSSYAVRKLALSDIGPLMQNGFRFLLAFLFMVVILLVQKNLSRPDSAVPEKVPLSEQLKYGSLVGVVYSIAATLQQVGLLSISSGEAGFISSLYTVLVPVMAYCIFRRKIKRQLWVAVAMSFAGLYLIAGGIAGFHPGMAIVMGAAACFALQMIFLEKYCGRANPILLVAIQVFWGMVISFSAAALTKEAFVFQMLQSAIWPICYTGVFSLGVGCVCQFVGQKRIDASSSAIICSLESVFAMIFGVLLLGDVLEVGHVLGAGLIFTAVIISQVVR